MDEYFAVHAARMRSDALTRFEGKFSISRRVLTLVHSDAAASH